MDGHVHITNRVYWEKADFWQPQPGNWDYGRARAAGINCIIDNLGTYGGWNYNYTPKIFLRLMETALRYAEQHSEKMAIVTTTADARKVIASGRMAVFLGNELGCGLTRATSTCSGGLLPARPAHRAVRQPDRLQCHGRFRHLHSAGRPEARSTSTASASRGRAVAAEMNRLGILIDITHGTDDTQKQLIEASKVPVVCSHSTIKAVSGAGMSDATLKLLASKGGVVGIHGGAAVVGKRYPQMGGRASRRDEGGRRRACPTCWATSPPSRARRVTTASTSRCSTRSSAAPGGRAAAGKSSPHSSP